ncbi:MAG: hypothetical protein WC683_01260 [bacterium]
MGPYRTIVEHELRQVRQRALQLEDARPLDAVDRGRMLAAEAQGQVLERILRAFDDAEAAALDEMYADHLHRAKERLRMARLGGS